MSDRPEPVRLGFVGAGGIARRHVDVLLRMEGVSIAGIADPDVDRAATLAEPADARAYRSHDELIATETLDGLYICVPPFAHGWIETAAIQAGLPFFVEKPVSVDLAVAEDIAAQVDASGLVTAVGYHWRYLDTVEEARRLLAERPASLVAGHWLDQTPPSSWWWRQSSSGGQIVEQATHIVDLARHLVGEITEVFASVSHAAPRTGFEGLDIATSTAVALRFDTGAVGTLSTTCLLRWGHRIGLHMFSDGLAIELSDREIMIDVGRGRPVRGAQFDPVELEDRDFVEALRGLPNRLRSPYPEAVKTHRAAVAIAQSAASRRPVAVGADAGAFNG